MPDTQTFSAPIIYPEKYSVIYTQEKLKEIAKTEYQEPTGFFHKLNELMQTPSRGFQWLLGKASEQRFDQTLRAKFNAIVIKSLAIISLILFALIIAPFALIGILTAALKQKYLPPLRYMAAESPPPSLPKLSKEKPLHLFQYNLGMGPNYKCLADGLETAESRAEKFIDWIEKQKDEVKNSEQPLEDKSPDIMLFQEVFNSNAKKILCKKLKKYYPYVVYSVAPHLFNMDSGQMIMSKYPIIEAVFSTIKIVSPDNITAPRVILIAKIETEKGILELYNLHTTPLLSDKRCDYRKQNIEQFFEIAQQRVIDHYTNIDKELYQIALGDLNLHAPCTPFNKQLPSEHTEQKTYAYIKERSTILPYPTKEEEDPFIEYDRKITEVKDLTTPSGTWIMGPYLKPTLAAKLVQRKALRYLEALPPYSKLPTTCDWGTENYAKNQARATTDAKLDVSLIPTYSQPKENASIIKTSNNPIKIAKISQSTIQASATIRNIDPIDAHRSISDHKPISTLISINNNPSCFFTKDKRQKSLSTGLQLPPQRQRCNSI